MGRDDAVYKICSAVAWHAARAAGVFTGSAVDVADGYIHLSTAMQVEETAAKHFRGERDLVLLEVATAPLGEALRFEPSRGGALFPHLYGVLPVTAVARVVPLVTDDEGRVELPDLVGRGPGRVSRADGS